MHGFLIWVCMGKLPVYIALEEDCLLPREIARPLGRMVMALLHLGNHGCLLQLHGKHTYPYLICKEKQCFIDKIFSLKYKTLDQNYLSIINYSTIIVEISCVNDV